MKLVYFAIIIFAIYIIATNINVVHIDTLDKKKIKKKKDSDVLIEEDDLQENFASTSYPAIDEYLGYSETYSGRQYRSRNPTKVDFDYGTEDANILPGAENLLILIKSEYIDTTYAMGNYKFNSMNSVVTNRYPNSKPTHMDSKYKTLIKKDIIGWNNLFPKYYDINRDLIQIYDVKLIFIMETEQEFVIQAIVKLVYQNKTMHFEVKYHGTLIRSDDILTCEKNTYDIKLLDVKPVNKKEFDAKITDNEEFASMKTQLTYVDKIKKMHDNESALYK